MASTTHIIPNEHGLPSATGIDTFYILPPHAIIEPDANDPVQRQEPFNIFQYYHHQLLFNNPLPVSVVTDSDEMETDDDVSKYTFKHLERHC